MSNQRQQGNQSNNRTNIWTFGLQLGLFAGLIWGGARGLMYFFRLTVIVPGYLAEPFYKTQFLKTQAGYYVGWLYFILFSIVAALLYTLFMRRLKGPYPGILYGIVWWLIIFLGVGPMLGMTKKITELPADTLISEFCLYLLWGLFIGYTAAMEFTDERRREPEKALQ
ncbi:YqhR family membrane protein [Paenibacillus woosongensis]|uniref:YqhR family membrane protein n=1 Tax=Paenibacillus woosongensis TaxID=307580 RepID=A0AA95I0G5_9BACL|nr:YqhR family membrane protein [Paenibacillus woosongensis]WHX47475.1 YqhR family membrane protein [Paenibacillus woosongensis]